MNGDGDFLLLRLDVPLIFGNGLNLGVLEVSLVFALVAKCIPIDW